MPLEDGQEVVWAKLRGFPWWPSLAEKKRPAKQVSQVTFLGTRDTSKIAPENIKPFDPNATDDERFKPPKKHALASDFRAAVDEAKGLLSPPQPLPPSKKRKRTEESSTRSAAAASASAGASTSADAEGTARRAARSQPTRVAAVAAPAKWFDSASTWKRVHVKLTPFRTCGAPEADPEEEARKAKAKAAAAAVEAARKAILGGGGLGGARGPPKRRMRLESAADRDPLRNPDPSRIEEFGFAECDGLISPELCREIARVPMDSAEGISNAFQKALEGPLLDAVTGAIGKSEAVADAMEASFGVRQFAVKTVKVLMTEFCAEPQIPHADDFCNRELFGICHLLPDQPRTECMPYNAHAAYPTNVSVECDACGGWPPLPDAWRGAGSTSTRASREHAGRTCEETRRQTEALAAVTPPRPLPRRGRRRPAARRQRAEERGEPRRARLVRAAAAAAAAAARGATVRRAVRTRRPRWRRRPREPTARRLPRPIRTW